LSSLPSLPLSAILLPNVYLNYFTEYRSFYRFSDVLSTITLIN
jgi:hypothetical protein